MFISKAKHVISRYLTNVNSTPISPILLNLLVSSVPLIPDTVTAFLQCPLTLSSWALLALFTLTLFYLSARLRPQECY